VCVFPWEGNDDDCGTCPGNWDPATDCTSCVNKWFGTNCDSCPGNWDADQDCAACVGAFDPDQNCTACLPGWSGASCTIQAECVRYVDIDSDNEYPNGLSWATAYTDIASAISDASYEVQHTSATSCDVWVATGTYLVGTDIDKIYTATGVHLYGGFLGNETSTADRDWEANPTIIDGQGTEYWLFNCYWDSDVVVDGFTVTGGHAYGSASAQYDGSAFRIVNCSNFTLRNCVVTDNYAYSQGSVYVEEGSIDIENVHFEGNQANDGPAVYISFMEEDSSITDCTFSGNESFNTGTVFVNKDNAGPTFAMIGCHFEGNTGGSAAGLYISTYYGATYVDDCSFVANNGRGIHISGSSVYDGTIEISNSVFSYNTVTDSGGAIQGSNGKMTITSCLFEENVAVSSGGAIRAYKSSPGAQIDAISNCVFDRNEGGNSGGAAISLEKNPATITNCVFWGNSGYDNGVVRISDNESEIRNSIFWGNTLEAAHAISYYGETTSVSFAYCDADEILSGSGNLIVDPEFADPAASDFHLQAGSPCIDSAWTAVAPTTDMEGNPRVDDPASTNYGTGAPWADIGAYEFQP